MNNDNIITTEENSGNVKSVLTTLIAIILGILVILTAIGWMTHGYIGSDEINGSLQNTQQIEERSI